MDHRKYVHYTIYIPPEVYITYFHGVYTCYLACIHCDYESVCVCVLGSSGGWALLKQHLSSFCDVAHVSILLITRQKTKVGSRDCIIHFTTD